MTIFEDPSARRGGTYCGLAAPAGDWASTGRARHFPLAGGATTWSRGFRWGQARTRAIGGSSMPRPFSICRAGPKGMLPFRHARPLSGSVGPLV